MRSRKVLLGVAILLLLATGALSACGGASEQPPAEESAALDGEALLEDRCTSCHGLDRTTSAQKTQAEWEETVSRMVDKGAQLNDEEQSVLVDYLAENYGP